MNTKKIASLLLFAALGTLARVEAQPQTPLTVAVYDFRGDADAANFTDKVTALVTADLTAEQNLVLVERSELNKALNEQAFGQSGMVNSEAAAKIGQITGAKVLVAGQVMNLPGDHLVIIANVIGTETGRLFTDKVDGPAENLLQLSSGLSRAVAQTISEQATNLALPAAESHEAFVDRIVGNLKGTNRPAVMISVTAHNHWGNTWRDTGVANELGAILMKAGFPVVDENSDRKPDVEITGQLATNWARQRANLVAGSATLELKITDRRTGIILALDHQESEATGLGEMVAMQAAKVKVTDVLAEHMLPLLAK